MTPSRYAYAVLAIGLVAVLVPVAPVAAQGFIIIEPQPIVVVPSPRPMPPPRFVHFPLEVKNQNVACSIQDTVGTTRIEQVFHNPNGQQMEGTYMLPMPETAAIQKFSMWMDGKEVKGEMLDADKARQTYEEIVRRTKDPGLLEYVGQRLYRARVFPIPANGDVRISLQYSETIAVSDGLATYRYPLNTEKYSAKPIEDVTIVVDIASQVPIKSVFCPSHTATVSQPTEKSARVGFEAHHVTPDHDFVVHYLMSDKEFGLSLLTFKPAAEQGYFLARIAPPFTTQAGQLLAKDVCFVLDTSGSMNGEKIAQAKKALNYCIGSLHKEDRFNLITFATDVRPFRDSIVEANSENVAAAKAEVEKIEAAGGTSIDEALKAALKVDAPRSGDHPFMIVFITDGEPTVGERDPEKILANVKAAANQAKSRLFVFGVGHDLNAKLLDRLADDNRGAREYISEKEDIEVKVSSFFKKVSDPVLSDIELKFADADSFDVYPKSWPDLFHGSELVVVGRYRSPGKHAVVMSGKRGSENMTWRFDASYAESTTASDFLPRLWATRKIGYLMDEIRLHGENRELKDEIVTLAKRHAIVTPYTSYLVIEDTPAPGLAGAGNTQLGVATRYFKGRERLGKDVANRRLDARAPQGGGGGFGGYGEGLGRVSGSKAVEASKEAYALRGAGGRTDQAAPNTPASEAGDYFMELNDEGDRDASKEKRESPQKMIKQVAGKTFYLDNGRWIDSTYDGKLETKKIKAFSDEYFALLKANAELGKYLALGERIIVMLNKTAYEVQ